MANFENPLPYMVSAVAIRFYLTTILVGQAAITGTPNDFLDWLALYTVGTVSAFPTVVNVILFLLVDGPLLVWLVLLIKRIVNPVVS